MKLWCIQLLTTVVVGFCFHADAQESLDAILDRGYVAHWLVCGPFRSDVPGGIVQAVREVAPTLGSTDYLAPIGGVARARPQHLTQVTTIDGVAIWQQAGAKDESLDLAAFFPDSDEGVAYAAFYAQTQVAGAAYIRLESSLGARVFLNGFPLRQLPSAPITAGGVDRFVINFRRGTNLVMIQMPGASFEALAKVAEMSIEQFTTIGMNNRTLLQKKSGFEIAMRILPAREFEGLAVVTRLRGTGSFTRHATGILQDTEFTVFNPRNVVSKPLKVRMAVRGVGGAIESIVPPIGAGEEYSLTTALPTGGATPGETLSVAVTVESGDSSMRFNAGISVQARPSPGTVFIIPTLDISGVDQRAETESYLSRFEAQMRFQMREPDYGFSLGRLPQWRPALLMYPGLRDALINGIALGRSGALASYDVLDERLVSGELMIRNLLYGYAANNAFLGDRNTSALIWGAPALAPQAAQILSQAGIAGAIEDLEHGGLAEVFYHESLDGSRLLHRHKRRSVSPRSIQDVRDAAHLQRREMLARGVDTDVFVHTPSRASPEAFWLGETQRLAHSVPGMVVSGAGGKRFFEEASGDLRSVRDTISANGRLLTSYQLGSLVSQVDVKNAYAETENLVLTAEKAATFAGMLGAPYPGGALDLAWRQILYSSVPQRLGFAPSPLHFVDALASYREAAEYGADVLAKSLGYIAEQVDTYSRAPLRGEGDGAILVFNPSSWSRTDLCEATLTLSGAGGVSLFDESGAAVSFLADRLTYSERRITSARIRFVARDVPSLGYKTFYFSPRGSPPSANSGKAVQISNEYLEIILDPALGGGMASVIDKATGTQFVSRLWNDVVAMKEDVDDNDHGREFWTWDDQVLTSSHRVDIELLSTDWMQQLSMTMPFLGGHVVRTISLYEGVRRIFCEVRFEGITARDRLLALRFGLDRANRVPVYGERFGSVTGRRGHMPFTLRTRGRENPSGTGAQAAFRWSAVSASHGLRLDDGTEIPFGPAAIVVPDDPALKAVAQQLQTALLHRGIPAAVWPDEPRRLDPIWSDSTELPNLNDDLEHGTAFRFVIGGADENRFTPLLYRQLHADVLDNFMRRMVDGAALFFFDQDVSEYAPAVPTLLMAGLSTSRTVEAVKRLIQSIDTSGQYRLHPDAYVPVDRAQPLKHGLAILHKGAALSGVEANGDLHLYLVHANRWPGGEGDLPLDTMADNLSFRYALYPFVGTWRDAAVQRAGHEYNEPFAAVQTDLHLGPTPSTQSFIRVDGDSFVVTSVRPTRSVISAMNGSEVHPNDGTLVRGYEAHGRPVDLRVSLFKNFYNPTRAQALDAVGASLFSTGRSIELNVGAFEISAISFEPAGGRVINNTVELGHATDPYGPVYTRYWRHNRGAAPIGFQPITLKLDGDLSSGQDVLTATVQNNMQDKKAEGTVLVRTVAGWSVAPQQFEFSLAPGEFIQQPVVLLRTQRHETTGAVTVRTTFNEQTYLDIVGTNDEPVTMKATKKRNEIEVLIENRTAITAQGFVDIIVPPDYWPELGFRSSVTVQPRRASVFVPPFGKQRLLFLALPDAPQCWIVAKLAASGTTIYKMVTER